MEEVKAVDEMEETRKELEDVVKAGKITEAEAKFRLRLIEAARSYDDGCIFILQVLREANKRTKRDEKDKGTESKEAENGGNDANKNIPR